MTFVTDEPVKQWPAFSFILINQCKGKPATLQVCVFSHDNYGMVLSMASQQTNVREQPWVLWLINVS